MLSNRRITELIYWTVVGAGIVLSVVIVIVRWR